MHLLGIGLISSVIDDYKETNPFNITNILAKRKARRIKFSEEYGRTAQPFKSDKLRYNLCKLIHLTLLISYIEYYSEQTLVSRAWKE